MEPHLPPMETHERDGVQRGDVASLVALVEKIDKRRAHAATENNEPSLSDTDDAFARLLESAREYATAAKTTHTMDGACEFDQSPPPSPTSENVLVGVLKRENASLLAKIRRLENDAKRHDDKSAWSEEHTMNRLKNAEMHAAEAIAENTRLEALYSEVTTQKNQLEEELAQAVAEMNRRDALIKQAMADMNRVKAELMEITTQNDRLNELLAEAIAEKCRCAPLWSEVNAKQSCLEASYNEALAEKKQLEAQLTEIANEKAHVEAQYEAIVAKKNHLQVLYLNVETEKIQLQALHAEVAVNKNQFEALYSEVASAKNHLETEVVALSEKSSSLEAQLAESRSDQNRLNELYSEAAAEKDRLQVECNVERLRAEEMQRTIAHLNSRLVEAHRALLDAKTNSMTALTRPKRSGTMETSGTDTDDSDSPSALSLSDLRIKDDSEPAHECNEHDKRLARSTMKNDSPRRRSSVRGRSIISSLIDHHSSASVDPSVSCSRSRCQSIDINTNKKNQRMRAERASLQTSPPRSAMNTTRDFSKSFSRYRSVEPPLTGQPSSQSNQPRPRWRL